MPKDFVERLQDLENEMKNVLSICDVTNRDIKSNKIMQRVSRVKNPVRCSSSSLDYSHFINNEKISDDGAVAEDLKSQKGFCRTKAPPCEKPSSAPGPLPAIKEVENYSKRKYFTGTSQIPPKKREAVEPMEPPEWFDCSPENHEENPEQSLRPVQQTLTDISQYGHSNYFSKRSTVWCSTCRRKMFDCICRRKRCTQTQHESCTSSPQQEEIDDEDDDIKESFIHHIKPGRQENPVINELVRKMERKEMEAKSSLQMDIQKPVKCKSDQIFVKQSKHILREKDCFEQSNEGNTCAEDQTSRKMLGHKKCPRPATAPAKPRNETPSSSEIKRSRLIHFSEMEAKPSVKSNLDLIPEEQGTETGNRKTFNCKSEGNVHCPREIISDECSHSDPESSIDAGEDLAQIKQKKNLSDETTRKIAEIIEKNHEKIEKMRKSKSSALNTVKLMKEKYVEMAEIKNELSEKFEKLLEKNEKLARELKETDESKQQLMQELENYKKANSSSTLLSRLQSVNEENLQSKEKIQVLEQQLQEKMQWEDENGNKTGSAINQDRSYEYHILFKKQEAAYRRLVQGIAVLEKVVKNNREKEKRLSEIKVELKRRAAKTQCYIERLTSEKTELVHMVNELRVFLEDRQTRVDELQEEINKKDEELEQYKKLLLEKSETLEDTNKELESIRKNSVDLEGQVKTLRNSIENFDRMHQNLLKERQSFENAAQHIQGENSKLQEQLVNEKESILIKDKIIEDQQETIKQLREKSEEAKTMVRKVQSLERLINVEREEKLELQETVERLRRKKDELKQKVKSLEADLLLGPQEVVRDLQRTQIILCELENQVQIKQREWEVVLQSLAREKEQACNVAAFATKKLIQTTSNFQKQSDAQKKLYKMLTENLVEKKKHLHESNEKAKQTVRFSDELQQSNIDDEKIASIEKHHLHPKQAGILKKSKEWPHNNQSLEECYSNLNFNKIRDIQSAQDFSGSDDNYDLV